MHPLKKLIILLLLVTLLGASYTVFYFIHQQNKLIIVSKESYFSHFSVQNDTVYMICHITVKNSFSKEKTFTLTAYSPEDAISGLLKNAEMEAVDEDEKSAKFLIPAHSEVSFDVTFTGKFTGTNLKQDRNLPEITIQNIK